MPWLAATLPSLCLPPCSNSSRGCQLPRLMVVTLNHEAASPWGSLSIQKVCHPGRLLPTCCSFESKGDILQPPCW